MSVTGVDTLRIVQRMKWFERAAALAKAQEVTHDDIADALGVTRGAVGHWLNGRREPDFADLRKMARLLKTTIGDLMGDPAVGDSASSGSDASDFVAVPPSKPTELAYVSRVVGAHLSAGSGEVLWDVDEVENSHSFRVDYMQSKGLRPERCKVWTVRGDSMEPRYRSGDIVLINMAEREPMHGKVFALVGDDGLRIKQLRRGATAWEMHSFNPDQTRYPPEPIVDENYAIIGRVRWRGGDED